MIPSLSTNIPLSSSRSKHYLLLASDFTFWIIHVNLWIYSYNIDIKANTIVMNAICNISQFLVSVSVSDESSSILAEYFSQHFLMKFGVCHLVILDDGGPFKGIFISICKILNLYYDIIAKRNHKDITVEHFHWFLNKGTAIAIEDRLSNNIFVPTLYWRYWYIR